MKEIGSVRREHWRTAISGISVQSEKLDREALAQCYVDMGHLARIRNPTNQYIEGRRGTGKTHLLSFFCETINGTFAEEKALAIKIDGRSINLESDPGTDARILAKNIYRELMLRIEDGLREFASDRLWHNAVPTERTPYDLHSAEQTTRVLEQLRHLISYGATRTHPTTDLLRRETDTTKRTTSGKVEAGGELSKTPKGQLSFNISADGSATRETEQTLSVTTEFVLPYLEIGAKLEEYLEINDLERIYIAIDEWSSVPRLAQPFLAEALKRTLFPRSCISLKICALPFQTSFSVVRDGQILGFDRNGDIFPALDLDDDLVFLNNREKGRRYFGLLLRNHLEWSLQRLLGRDIALPTDVNETLSSLYTEAAFDRLLAYAQGNARDFLTLFRTAWDSADGRQDDQINVLDVERAAKALGIEKLENIAARDSALELFNDIVNEVLYRKKKGAFFVDTEYSSDEDLLFLIHQRAFHVAERTYSAPRHAGRRFLVLAIDFCIIVDHLKSPNYRDVMNNTLNLELPFTDEQRQALEDARKQAAVEAKLLQLDAPDKREVRYTVLDPALLRARHDGRECESCGKGYSLRHPVVMKHKVCPHCGEKPSTALS